MTPSPRFYHEEKLFALSLLGKESSEENQLVPFLQSPFVEKPAPPPKPEPKINHQSDKYIVYFQRVPWSDLLLEIAMTTTFASLTDGRPLMDGSSVLSYLCFFALVWWVWASQVAYNVRFRQSDWFHRIFVFLQLLVFCALAAFTAKPDITNGIASDLKQQKAEQEVLSSEYSDVDVAIETTIQRTAELPTLNARGISIIMALSRLLLLSQYALAYFHARNKDRADEKRRSSWRSAFLIHIGTLLFTSLCYFIAYAVIGQDPTEGDSIAKLVLWYFPIVVEMIAHFVAAYAPGRVSYPADAIYERSSSAFVIILGGGLDKITNGFQNTVGNISMSFRSFAPILGAAVIFILLFTLYFGSTPGGRLGSRRALALFFFNFFYLCALIVTLQGIAALLTVGNLGVALETPFNFVNQTGTLLDEKGFGSYLNETDYDWSSQKKLNKTGVSLTSVLNFINYGVDAAWNASDYNLTYNYVLQADIYIIEAVLKNFDVFPDEFSPLYANMSAFFDSDASNYTIVNNATFLDIAQHVVKSNANPAKWFYASGGLVLLFLAGMRALNRMPRNVYEKIQTFSRVVVGLLFIALSALDLKESEDVLNQFLQYQGSRIWYLATHSWVLPPYALALFFEQSMELVLLYMDDRSRRKTRLCPFPGRTPTMLYTSTPVAESGEVHRDGQHSQSLRRSSYDTKPGESTMFAEASAEEIPLHNIAIAPAVPYGAPRSHRGYQHQQTSSDLWQESHMDSSKY